MLDNMNKENPFKIPDNYFDNFHREMMDKIQPLKKQKTIPLWRKIAPWGVAAAAIICGVVISVGGLTTESKTDVANAEMLKKDKQQDLYASSDEEYFMLFLNDEYVKDSYGDIVLNEISQ